MSYAAALHLRVRNNGDALPVHRGPSVAGCKAEAGTRIMVPRSIDQCFRQHGRRPEHARPLCRAELVKRIWHVLSAPETNEPQAFLHIGLNNFRSIQDEAGHAASDWALCEIAIRFNEVVRGRDTLARLDAGEFGLLLERCPLETARLRAEQLHQAVLSYALHWNGGLFRLGASIGLAFFRTRRHNLNSILYAADMACSRARREGVDGMRIREALLD